jgi:hypothetical protein
MSIIPTTQEGREEDLVGSQPKCKTLSEKQTKVKRAGGVGQVVEWLTS